MEESSQSIYDFSAPLLDPLLSALPATLLAGHMDGQPLSFGSFQGRVLLIVNTASDCGFTPQYAGLETLYCKYRERGFEVLGFPCNQFGGQEPETGAAIGSFCQRNYGVTFPLFEKIEVNGPNAHPLYIYLKKQKPGILGFLGSGAIRWNFTKFLVDREGAVVARFAPSRAPEKLSGAIERLLGDG